MAGIAAGKDSDEGFAFVVATDFTKVASTPLPPNSRLLDSGASRHFEPRRENFTNFQPIAPKPINSADGRVFHALGQGDVPISVSDGQRSVKITLKNVLFAPNMPISLISISQMIKGGFFAHFEKDGCHILSPTRAVILIVSERLGLYPVLPSNSSSPPPVAPTASSEGALSSSPKSLTLTEFHRIMGHAYPGALRKMVAEGVVTGVSLEDGEASFCEPCIQAKHSREPFPKERSSPQATTYGERIHSDLWGQSQVKTLGGKEYFMSFLDDATDEVVVVLLARKSEALSKYKNFDAWAKTQRGVKEIKVLQCDRGGEYTSNDFRDFLASKGTNRRLTTHDSPQQNGKAERLNWTLMEHVRAVLFDAELPKFLWGEALMHITYLRNRTTTRNTPGSTPFEKATGSKPDLSSLPRFGAKVWVLSNSGGKLDPKSVEGRWVGFDSESKAHRVYFPAKRSVSVERNVRFEPELVETSLGIRSEGEQVKQVVPNAPESQEKSSSADPNTSQPPTTKSESETSIKAPESKEKSSVDPQVSQETSQPQEIASKRVRQPSRWLRDLQSGKGQVGGRGAQKIPPSVIPADRKSTRLNSSHSGESRMPSSA